MYVQFLCFCFGLVEHIYIYQKNYEARAIPQAQWTRAWRIGSRVTRDLSAVVRLDHLSSSIFCLTSAPEQKLIQCKNYVCFCSDAELRRKVLNWDLSVHGVRVKWFFFIFFFKNHQMMLGRVVPLMERAKDKLKVR